MKTLKIGKLGWKPDLPDIKDFTSESTDVKGILGGIIKRIKPI